MRSSTIPTLSHPNPTPDIRLSYYASSNMAPITLDDNHANNDASNIPIPGFPSAVRARWVLRFQAVVFRFLMAIGMFFHRTAIPYPPNPTFELNISTTVAPKKGKIQLCVYSPSGYDAHKRKQNKKNNHREESDVGIRPTTSDSSFTDSDADSIISNPTRATRLRSINPFPRLLHRHRDTSPVPLDRPRYPVVLSFHGGGFTLGKPTDDCRWASNVVARTGAVVISVGYRLAPEHPFPTAVEDGVDALLWIAKHGDRYDLDPNRIIISGFSSGGNLAFTVPLRLDQELKQHGLCGLISGQMFPEVNPRTGPPIGRSMSPPKSRGVPVATYNTPGTEHTDSPIPFPTRNLVRTVTSSTAGTFLDSPAASTHNLSSVVDTSKNRTFPSVGPTIGQPPAFFNPESHRYVLSQRHIPPTASLHIRGIVSFYPSVDYTMTRDQRKATCTRPEMNLSSMFTNMFDDSYIGNPPITAIYQHANTSYVFPPDHPSMSTATLEQPQWPAPAVMAFASPFLSPAVARDDILEKVMPDNILILAAEWDMLRWETNRFADRLSKLYRSSPPPVPSIPSFNRFDTFLSPPDVSPNRSDRSSSNIPSSGSHPRDNLLERDREAASASAAAAATGTSGSAMQTKNVQYWCVPEQPHAWDKKPYFWGREKSVVEEWYSKSCQEISSMFGTEPVTNPVLRRGVLRRQRRPR